MAKKILNKYIGALTMGAVILAMPACSDTWDDHYAETSESTATQTLWEQISSNPNLSRFAAIAQKAKYYRDESHPCNNYTFADLLKSNQVETVWAPENSAFTDEEYNKYMNLCETNGYTVQQQLLGNHIATWRWALNGEGLDTLKMINDKNLIFDKDNATIAGVKINQKNIAATNGTLHTISGLTPFDWNFYEYIKYNDELPLLKNYICSKDTTYFMASASIEGIPDENGNPTYVDSVYRTSNRMFSSFNYLPANNSDDWMTYDECFNANLQAEDSMFIMLMPTDQCWNNTVEMLSPYYKYAPVYLNRKNGLKSSETQDECDPDSMANMNIGMDIVSPLVFNIHKQPKIKYKTADGEDDVDNPLYTKKGTPWTMEHWLETKGKEAEYVLNTRYDTLRSTALWDQTTLFNGNVVEMSNGYGYEIEKWAYPSEFYKPDVEVEVQWDRVYDMEHNSTGTFKSQSFSTTTFKAISDKYGKVSKNNFYIFGPQGTGTNPKAELKLAGNLNEAYVPSAEVMSGKYDIYIVMVPYWYKAVADAGELDSLYLDSAYVDSIAQLSKNKLYVQINYNNGTAKDASSTRVTLDYNAQKVDTVLAVADFEFPYSYKNLRYSYPTMTIQGAPTSSEVRSKGYIRQVCIDRIILKSKENEIEIDPSDPTNIKKRK